MNSYKSTTSMIAISFLRLSVDIGFLPMECFKIERIDHEVENFCK